ncbi:MAG TPA: hypothetical protein VF292_05345 [Rhodanobacteraceae bacterium]
MVSIAESAAKRRRELSREWLTASQAGILLGARTVDDAAAQVMRERRDGRVLGVWVPSEQDYRYPPWQFRSDGTAVQELSDILTILREHGGVIDHGRRISGWNEIEWFMTPHVLLRGRTPIELLATCPVDVVAAARTEFIEERAQW